MKKIEFASAWKNLKKNWFFLISAMAFFCVAFDNALGYCLGLIIVFGIMAFFSAKTESVWDIVKGDSSGMKIFNGLTAIGVCLGNQQHFYGETFKLGLPEKFNIVFLAISVFGAVFAVYFVFVCLSVFWKKMMNIVADTGVFQDVKPWELGAYAVLFLLSVILVTVSFMKSEAFYETEYLYDILYTSDTPALIKDIVYLVLVHPQNDLRQPLFAVFAAPFIGLPYLLGMILGTSVRAILVDCAQLVMLFAANYMLTKMMKLDPAKRVCFMLLTCCTYTYLLFSLMMEQYIVAYFWLIFCMYQICEKQQPERFALWGAGGTLLTSMVLLPFMSEKSPLKNFKAWFMDMVKYGLEFVALMLVFCRFDVITRLIEKYSEFAGYTGKNLTMMDKFCQYTEFIRSCFLAPDAGVSLAVGEHASWQLNAVTGISLVGIAILTLVFISAVWNRDKKISLCAAGWVVFSAVMLWLLGWGTKENGLILYALYFGWAFLALLFQLVEKIEEKLRIKYLTCACCIGCGAVLAVVNFPAILEMVNFAIRYFPV